MQCQLNDNRIAKGQSIRVNWEFSSNRGYKFGENHDLSAYSKQESLEKPWLICLHTTLDIGLMTTQPQRNAKSLIKVSR